MERYQQGKSATFAHFEYPRERIESTLATIVVSEPFRTSPQCRDLLQHIVSHTLNSEHELLKERVLGATVFGRKPDYDTASDSIVRVRAADVRKRLAQFYQSDACLPGMIRIDVPTGGYHASFRALSEAPQKAAAQTANSHDESGNGPEMFAGAGSALPADRSGAGSAKGTRSWLRIGASFLLLLTVAGVCWAVWRPHKVTLFEQFWAPALSSPKAITIYNADNPAYRLRCDGEGMRNQNPFLLAQAPIGLHNVPCEQTKGIKASDLIPIHNQLITIGDGYATALLCALFARHDKPYQLRYASELSFIDLRYSPAVLIGAFNNEWTLETTRELKFVFSEYPSIRERGGQNRVWALAHVAPDGKTTEDYAIVSRVFNTDTGQVLIATAGITQYGTRAAGEFLTTEGELGSALRNLPSGWAKRNVQFVIHTQVFRDTPGRPMVVASSAW